MGAYCMIARALLKSDYVFFQLVFFTWLQRKAKSDSTVVPEAESKMWCNWCKSDIQLEHICIHGGTWGCCTVWLPQLASKKHIYQNHYYVKGTVCCPSAFVILFLFFYQSMKKTLLAGPHCFCLLLFLTPCFQVIMYFYCSVLSGCFKHWRLCNDQCTQVQWAIVD